MKIISYFIPFFFLSNFVVAQVDCNTCEDTSNGFKLSKRQYKHD